MWQSRQAESRLAPNWLTSGQGQTQPNITANDRPEDEVQDSITDEANKFFSTALPSFERDNLELAQDTEPKVQTPTIDGESLWNTLGASLDVQPPSKVSPIADPAVVLAKKASLPSDEVIKKVTSSTVPTKSGTPEPEQQAWFYVDPSGTLQGPFSGQQMEEWDNEGYFPDELRLRPAVSDLASNVPTDERGFITLSKLRSSLTPDGRSPFLSCNLSPRQLEVDVTDKKPEVEKWTPVEAPTNSDFLPQQVDEQPKVENAHALVDSKQDTRETVEPPSTKIGIALTTDVEREPEGWVEDNNEEGFDEAEQQESYKRPDSKHEKKKRNRKKVNKSEKEKEAPIDPLLNAEPAEVRRARMAAEQLRLAEENTRKLEDQDAIIAGLQERKSQREKEREFERKQAQQIQARQQLASKPKAPPGPPALPATAKWAVSQPSWNNQQTAPKGKQPASLLEIQRQEAMAEKSERVQEEHRKTLAATIAASNQSQQQSGWGYLGASYGNQQSQPQQRSSGAPWSSPAVEPVSRKAGNTGFWDDDEEEMSFEKIQQQQKQQKQPAPKLSNILGNSAYSNAVFKLDQRPPKSNKLVYFIYLHFL